MIIKVTDIDEKRVKLLFVSDNGKPFGQIWAPRDEMPEGVEKGGEVAFVKAYTYIPPRLRFGVLRQMFKWQS